MFVPVPPLRISTLAVFTAFVPSVTTKELSAATDCRQVRGHGQEVEGVDPLARRLAGRLGDGVGPPVAPESVDVIAQAADEGVVARTAAEGVIELIAGDRVVPRAADDRLDRVARGERQARFPAGSIGC